MSVFDSVIINMVCQNSAKEMFFEGVIEYNTESYVTEVKDMPVICDFCT